MRRRAALLLAVAAALPSCADPTGTTVDRAALARARAQWAAQGIASYTLEARELCFCPPGVGQWMEITVANGTVVSSRAIDVVPIEASGPRRTVEQMFDFIAADHGLGKGVHLDVDYDPALGYPRSIVLRADDPPPDFGLSIQARNLKRQQ